MSYTVKQLQQLIGTTAAATFELSLKIHVVIRDVREHFGRVDVLVAPVAGSGEKWISNDRLSPVK